uniref:Serine--tRNA ligase n=1 Tax=Chromera velia CCMP2878 TaxID=1169474 RepID=A0A0G4FRA0_9ALVE|mmetsp:Transcript_42589/g.83978  ORF Transcript_42589/g.83978 Transcript_42589/m.83978 type:complete len:531 (-) Transcript_42589:69-1661(-)|eukprot:Cvel_18368.t1-p1 / transcript=Cvel_18368.t1 / gene=Cvel_18368 / organism=Chromera_velia_CCMP2878 / gene_product=Serine--tRNA ligase, putative / transcript_product=Serine--tRNA ligase, putative / location=Cvel_scaffold1518:1468-8068(+) / protein_length=530 / sequence_SO=supercontig / SO=protein_coding / is_pseudo=false
MARLRLFWFFVGYSACCSAFLPLFKPSVRLSLTVSSDSAQSVPETATSASSFVPKPSVDFKTISDDPETVKESLRLRRADQSLIDSVDRLVALNARKNELTREGDEQRAKRKRLSQQIGVLMKKKNAAGGGDGEDPQVVKEIEELRNQVEDSVQVAAKSDEELEGVAAEANGLLLALPNFLDDQVPEGNDETENEVLYEWGAEKCKKGESFLWHDEIASRLGSWMPEAAAAVSGARFAAFTGGVARLERAIAQLCLDTHADEHGYKEAVVPIMVGASALEATGQLPKFEDDLFRLDGRHTLNGEPGFLIPTAEVPLTNLFKLSILDEKDLPLKLVAHTPCFRAEAGSYGRDTRGYIRQHVFHKVELVKVCTPETSAEEHEALTADAEKILQKLELPYRKVRLCSGDIGFSAAHCYDLEVWLPGQQMWREISSCSNCWDFQARRAGLRYRPQQRQGGAEESGQKGGKKGKNKPPRPVHCHTINGSGLAVGRCLVAVLENYQKALEDGRIGVEVPEVLQKYMGGCSVLEEPE